MATPFHTTRFVEFSDTDMAGIVHFSAFFRFMESAEHQLLRSLGFSIFSHVDGETITFPRVAASCDYFKPAKFEDVLDVAVTLARVGRKSVTYAFEFSKSGEAIARGQVSSVCCRVHEDHRLESIEIPASFRRRLEVRGESRARPTRLGSIPVASYEAARVRVTYTTAAAARLRVARPSSPARAFSFR